MHRPINASTTSSFLDSYDILTLSETFGSYSSRRDRLVDTAASRGFKWAVAGPDRNWWKFRFVDSGLLVLSRFPIVATDKIMYSGGFGSDRVAAKGILYTRHLLSTTTTLHLFVSHLQSSYTPPSEDDADNLEEHGAKVRKRQLKTLRKFVQKTVRKAKRNRTGKHEDVVLLAGDFNVPGNRFAWDDTTDSAEYNRMIRILEGRSSSSSLLDDDDDPPRFTITDILRTAWGRQVPTWNDWDEQISSSTAEERKNVGKRLDYILDWRVRGSNSSGYELVEEETRVEGFEVDGLPFKRLSDHKGVVTVLNRVPE
ncbi:hypothetical protein HK104_000814 [Borealophlyctis nickersoniae]|nr:hypothetical protein HK104_000814 [Borealophlyctis nickersoniae]